MENKIIEDTKNTVVCGDSLTILKTFPDESVDCVVTSPPYWALRDYGVPGQLGLEPTFQEYINRLCDIFDEIKRVLKKEGTCFINIGDTYMGNSSYSEKGRQGLGNDKVGMINKKQWLDPKYPHKEKLRAREHIISCQISEKSLCQIPSRFAIEMSNRGWILRNTIIWHKSNCMPSSVKDRFTVDFEKVFFFVKNKKYFFKQQLEKTLTKNTLVRNRDLTKLNNTPGRTRMNGLKVNNYDFKNKRCVWTIPTRPFKEAHFATYPEKLIEPMIDAGCPIGGVILDPFFGAGTTGLVARKQNKNYIGIELNPTYIKIAEERLKNIN